MANTQQHLNASSTPPWIMTSSSGDWEKIFHLGVRKQWSRKALMYDFGDPANELVLILDGLIKIVASSWSGDLRSIGILGPGSILGEAAFFRDATYKHMIRCVDACDGIVFPREVVLETILREHPDLSYYLFKNLARKSYVMSTQLECVTFMSSEQNIAHFLYHLAMEQKKESWIYKKMSSISLITLAELLGMHRVTVTKIMNSFKKNSIISMGDHIRITSTDALVQILHSGV